MAQETNIPRKFKEKEFSFIESFVNGKDKDKSFQVFPKNVQFVRKEKDEEVILVIRRHWSAYATHIFFAVIIPLIPLGLLFITRNMSNIYGASTVYLGLFVASVVMSVNIIVTALMQWYYNVAIITDKRVVALNVVSVFHHVYTEILWRRIQDVSHDSVGPFSSVFDIGNIFIDTAGEGVDLTLTFIPKPREVQDVINNLVDLAHKGKL